MSGRECVACLAIIHLPKKTILITSSPNTVFVCLCRLGASAAGRSEGGDVLQFHITKSMQVETLAGRYMSSVR